MIVSRPTAPLPLPPGYGEQQHRHQQLRRAVVGPPRDLLCPAWSPSTAGLPEQM